MNGHKKICLFMLWAAVLIEFAASSKRESRTGGLHIPEKIIGGVIDIVQSHKNKPVAGAPPTYPPNPQYNYQQYPQYQQWNGQSNFQNQGFQAQPQYQGTYQNQGQYNYQQTGFNQGGNFPQGNQGSGQSFNQGSGQSFTQGQNQQGQYQVVYQNPNQFGQSNNQYQNTQSGYYTGQNQANNQYQGSSTNFQGQTGQSTQGTGQYNQGFMTGSQTGAGNGQGPTCVCQAWTKPQPIQEIYGDSPVTEKVEKKEEAST